MNRSVIAQQGTPHELYEQPASAFIADFIGDANLVEAEILSTEAEMATVSIAGVHCQLPNPTFSPGGITVAIRPDAVRLAPQNGPSTPAALPGHIRHATYLGNQIQYEVESSVGNLFVVDYRPDRAIRAGTDVDIQFADRGLALVAA